MSRIARIVADAMERNSWRSDSGEVATFTRQLEFIYARTFDKKYPELRARSIIPVDQSVAPGAELATYGSFDQFGEAAIIHPMAVDLPTAEIQGSQVSTPIVSLGASYGYTVQNMRAAMMAGLQLDARKALAARRTIEAKMDKLACIGDTNSGLKGLATDSNITAVTVITKTTANTWAEANSGAGATVDQVMADLNKMANAIFTNTLGIYEPDTLVLSTGAYAWLATRPRSTTYTDDTMLQYVIKSSPWLKTITYWNRLDTAGGSSLPRLLMFKRDPEVMQMIIPQDFEQFPPQAKGLGFMVPCHARFGGVQVRYPKAVAYMDGAFLT